MGVAVVKPGIATAAVVALTVTTAGPSPTADAAQPSAHSIAVDAANVRGFVQPAVTGQMMEWAEPEMNLAWAEKAQGRSFEQESVTSGRSVLYDAFTGASLDRSRWTPMSLDTASPGTVSVSNSELTITPAEPGRFGVASTDQLDSEYVSYAVEARIVSHTGTNAILSLYGGGGSGDFSKFVEFAIDGGVLKVFADGQPTWTGPSATTPATLRIEATPLADGTRDLRFFHDGSLVHTLDNFSLLPAPYRVFLYGWDGAVTYDYVTIDPDDTFDDFDDTTISARWTPTLLEGSTNGSLTFDGDTLTITGATGSRYGILSEPIRNSAIDWTTVSARLEAVTGTNGLLSIYGGDGAGDFTRFVEFGVENGTVRVFTSSGAGNFTGSTVTLPVELRVTVSPYYANGRRYRFYVDGSQVHELVDQRDVPADDFRLFLYGYGNSTSTWNDVEIHQRHMWDLFAPHFEGGPGLSVEWTPTTLAGGWGSASQGNSQLTINGATNSRYGVISRPLPQSDIYGYTVEAKLDSYTGTNALLDIYAGSGRGDFSKFIEFGIEGGVLRVFGDGLPSWTGPTASTPAVLRIEVSPWLGTGRDFYFYYNDQLVHALENVSVIPNQEYRTFLYGWSTSTTKWDYLTWGRRPLWSEDGHTNRATYQHVEDSYNGRYAQQVTVTQDSGGRKGISQGGYAVVAGRAHEVSLYLKQQNLQGSVTVALGPDQGDHPTWSPYASATISNIATSWTKRTVTLTPDTSDGQAKLLIAVNGTGTVAVDMVSVMPTDPAEVAHGGWRKDFVDRLVVLDPKAIRWPGGIIADWYHWEDGIGDRDARPPMLFAQWDARVMTNDVGTHEILDLAGQLGIDVTLNVNWGTGSTSEAADWVEYVNGADTTTQGSRRAANGRSQPWGLETWEIGNEVWGWWTPGHTSDPQVFADSYVLFRDAMYARDNTIEFIGEGGDGNNTDETWNQTLVSTAAAKLDHLSTHYYPPQSLPQGYDDLDVYEASVGAPATISDRLDGTQATILDNSDEDIKVAVTEYNAMYFNEERRRTRTLEAALQVAGQLNLFVRRPELIERNFYSALVNFWDGGAIRLGNRGSFVTPSYEALSLFANRHGPVVAQTEVTSTTYNATAIGNLPARSGIPHIDATTTRAADGSKLYVSVVNRHPTDPLTVDINLSNAGAIGSTATEHVLTSASYLDQNTWQNPSAVAAVSSPVTGVSGSFSHTFAPHSYTILELDTSANAVDTSAVIGQVTTATGTPIAGATVDIGTVAQGTTDSEGFYRIPVATPGTYTLTASATGYQTSSVHNVELRTGGATALPIRLSS